VDVLTLMMFAGLGLQANRNELWWAMVVPVIVAAWFTPARSPEGTEDVPASPRRIAGVPILIVLVVGLLVVLPWWRGDGATTFLTDAPVGLSAAARRLPAGTRMFNLQKWGSWLEWDSPATPVFADSRIELFTPSTWADYSTAIDAKPGWAEVLDRWHVGAVVAASDSGITKALLQDPAWRIASQDGDGVLFVRR